MREDALILHFVDEKRGREYLVIVPEDSDMDDAMDWARSGFKLVGRHDAEISELYLLPTEDVLMKVE